MQVIQVSSGREWRGGERQVLLLARGLARLGMENQCLITRRGSPLETRVEQAGVPVHACEWSVAHDPRALGAILSAGRRALARPRLPVLFHAHDPHALVLTLLVGRWLHCPVLVTRRVDFPLRRPWLWRRAAHIIAISEAVRGVLLGQGILPSRVTVVRSATDLEALRSVRPIDLRRHLGLPPHSSVAVSVGALVAHKDYANLIQAAALARGHHPLLHWVIVGDGPLRGTLTRQIAAAGLENCVHLLGQVEDPLGFIAGADCFVASSREEGLNTSILDAHGLGIPVVGTDAGGIPEALVDGSGLVVPREDPAALASGVARVISSREEARDLVRRARDRLEEWSPARMAAEVLSVYRSPDFSG